jgi:hypothetical protein
MSTLAFTLSYFVAAAIIALVGDLVEAALIGAPHENI